MKIRIRNNAETAHALYRDGIPLAMVHDIMDREFDVPSIRDGVEISHVFNGKPGKWNIAAECVIVVEE